MEVQFIPVSQLNLEKSYLFKFKVVFLILDELSMVSSDLWTDVDSTLGEIFMLITEKQFAGL